MTNWKLVRWKPCDGGCCVRSPRFPKDNLDPLDPTRPAFHADCRFHLNEAGGTSPDGTQWRGGCAVYKELLALMETAGGDEKLVGETELDKQTELTKIRSVTTEPLRQIHADGGLQWFFETCWEWPAETPTMTKLRMRLQELGLVKALLVGGVLDYSKVYTDEERAAIGQEFHITSDMTKAERDAEEPACCHMWELQ